MFIHIPINTKFNKNRPSFRDIQYFRAFSLANIKGSNPDGREFSSVDRVLHRDPSLYGAMMGPSRLYAGKIKISHSVVGLYDLLLSFRRDDVEKSNRQPI